MRRIMWIEDKSEGVVGPARIGWVDVQRGGKRIVYRDRVFLSLRGRGFKANFRDRETDQPFWISGCRKDGMDALYGTEVTIDEDARETYWLEIRQRPDLVDTRRFHAGGKY